MRQLYERHSLAPNDYAKFEAATQVADAQQSTALEHLAHTRLTSPISGIVVRRGIDPGETVGAGTPVFTIVAVDRVTIRVGIPEAQIGLVRPGAAAAVAVPALAGQPFQARVTMIGASADAASRTYPVKLEVPNPRHLLLPGMIAEARIDGDRITRALTVPGEAVVRDAEGATLLFVYAPAERRVHSRRVTVGAPIDREIEITDGLEPGELVVVAGQDRVRDGAAVAATAEGAQSGPATAAPTTINRAEPAR
jgi:RND family efflux transporter MFP subunit